MCLLIRPKHHSLFFDNYMGERGVGKIKKLELLSCARGFSWPSEKGSEVTNGIFTFFSVSKRLALR